MNARIVAVVALALSACSSGSSSGSGGGGGGGGTGGASGGGSGGSAGAGGGTSAAKLGTFLDMANGSNGRFPQLMIDAAGTRHMIYELLLALPGSTAIPFRYGECSANCELASSWKFASVGDRGTFGNNGKLALTAQGKPRIIWAKADTSAAPTVFQYASCDADCTTAGSWTTGPIYALPVNETLFSKVGRNLAVDANGRAHFVYANRGLNYMTCASNCTAMGSWSAPLKIAADEGRVSVATTSSGEVQVAYTFVTGGILGYRTCASGCSTLANWSAEAALRPSNEGLVSLRLDAQGHPRIFYSQAGAGTPALQDTLYGWCDSGCATPANWTFVTIGLQPTDGKNGLDFDLHSSGAVFMAMETAGGELGIVQCLSSCQSLSGMWSRTVVENSDLLKAELSPPLPDCSNFNPPKTPFASWYPGEQSSAAVNPTTAKVEVVHRVYTLAKCGFGGNTFEGVTISRYSGGFF